MGSSISDFRPPMMWGVERAGGTMSSCSVGLRGGLTKPMLGVSASLGSSCPGTFILGTLVCSRANDSSCVIVAEGGPEAPSHTVPHKSCWLGRAALPRSPPFLLAWACRGYYCCPRKPPSEGLCVWNIVFIQTRS